jgi:hypothetical protein
LTSLLLTGFGGRPRAEPFLWHRRLFPDNAVNIGSIKTSASCLDKPSRTMASRNWSAIPMPTLPAPKMITR